MEGRVLRIDLHDSFKVDDIRKLIEIKIPVKYFNIEIVISEIHQ